MLASQALHEVDMILDALILRGNRFPLQAQIKMLLRRTPLRVPQQFSNQVVPLSSSLRRLSYTGSLVPQATRRPLHRLVGSNASKLSDCS